MNAIMSSCHHLFEHQKGWLLHSGVVYYNLWGSWEARAVCVNLCYLVLVVIAHAALADVGKPVMAQCTSERSNFVLNVVFRIGKVAIGSNNLNNFA